MKIRTTEGQNSDGLATFRIAVDGKDVVNAWPPEPEDAILERDLSFVYDIVPLMKRAYEAGKAGEPFEVQKVMRE